MDYTPDSRVRFDRNEFNSGMLQGEYSKNLICECYSNGINALEIKENRSESIYTG